MTFPVKTAPSDGSTTDSSRTLGQRIAILGFVLYVAFAPHSIAGAEISIGIAGIGWLLRTLATRNSGLRRTRLDLPLWLFVAWTILSSLLSEEPNISIPKLQSVSIFLLFYMTQAVLTRRTATALVWILLVSGVAGTLYSVFDLVRGRGVIVSAISDVSPLRQAHIEPGDTVWRINKTRVYSTKDIDAALKATPTNTNITVSVISRGEHAERPGLVVTDEIKSMAAPSGITGGGRTHRFRASGWTRHYATFSEVLQILAQLALGIALANLRNHGNNLRFRIAIAVSAILAIGIVLTAMRTVLVAFAIGGAVILLRATRGKTRLVAATALGLVLMFGAFFVWQTRAQHALSLGDSSSALRVAVARVGAARVMLHPVFGHGMDAVKRHWNEWGFPGDQMVGLHSTPLQLAFDRGLPALFFWLWLVVSFWLFTSRAERQARDASDTSTYGLLLGTLGAITGFLASAMVNYNFGDSEVALLFWWLMGIVVVLSRGQALQTRSLPKT